MPIGTVQMYVYVPVTPGVAVTVAVPPAQITGLFTVTVGTAFTITVPDAGELVQEPAAIDTV